MELLVIVSVNFDVIHQLLINILHSSDTRETMVV